jgi:hypothetical protein
MEAQAVDDPPRAKPDRPKASTAPPAREKVVMDALPVVEQPHQPSSLRREEPAKALPPRRSGGNIFVALLLGVTVGLGGVVIMFLSGYRPSGGLMSRLTTVSPTEKVGEPIKPEEFHSVLKTLQDKPSLPELRHIAQRLAVTPLTPEQKRKHADIETKCSLGNAGPPLDLQEQKEKDDVYRVSWALKPLLATNAAPADRKLAAQALQTWGTRDNVEDLCANVRHASDLDVRIESGKALASIGDERGVAALRELASGKSAYRIHAQAALDAIYERKK